MNTGIGLVAGLATTFAILAGPATSASGQDVTLQYRWTKGEEIRQRLLQESTTTASGIPGNAGEMTVETSMSQVVRTIVDDVAPDGTATLRYTYESVRWETKSPAGVMTYDSAAKEPAATNPGAGMTKDMLSALIGESFVMLMSPTGQVQKVEGMNRLMEKMLKSLPQDPATAAVLEGLKNSFSDEAMRGALARGYTQFPSRPLKPGDTWDNGGTATHPMLGRLTTTSLFTLKAVEANAGDRMARITTNVTFKTDQNAGAGGLLGLKVQLGDSSGEGELIFDVGRGRLQRSTTRTTMPMEIAAPGPGGAAMNMRTLVKSVFTIEVLQPSR